eukprot:3391960-Prymnesium_polylepis.1
MGALKSVALVGVGCFRLVNVAESTSCANKMTSERNMAITAVDAANLGSELSAMFGMEGVMLRCAKSSRVDPAPLAPTD